MSETKMDSPQFAHDVGDLVKVSGELREDLKGLQKENAELRTQMATMQKTAAMVPANGRVTDVVDNIVASGMLKRADRDAAIQAIATDPVESLLGFIDKLAKQRLEKGGMTKLGQGIGAEKTAAPAAAGEPQQRESDRVYEERFGIPRG